MSGSSDYVNITHTRLHGSWMKYKSPDDKNWKSVWCVLRDNIIFFFTSEQACLETHIGTLHLGSDSSFHVRDGDLKNGFKFELYTTKKKNKFKVPTMYERELWRAYLEGVIKGKVPPDVILSPKEISDIQEKIICIKHTHPQNLVQQQALPVTVPNSSTEPSPSVSSFDRQLRKASIQSHGSNNSNSSDSISMTTGCGFDPPLDSVSDTYKRSHSSGGSSGFESGGPFMHHKFYSDRDDIPVWFFAKCSRDMAEKILREYPELGNTLMRESFSARPTGSYVISKRMERSGEITHYEVIRVAEGYQINVENKHPPMKTLSEVMDFFTQLSGRMTTRLMQSNDMKAMGMQYADYTSHIFATVIDVDSREGEDFESKAVYEEPVILGVDEDFPPPPPPLPSAVMSPISPFDNSNTPPPPISPFDIPNTPPPPPPTSSPRSLSIAANSRTWSTRKIVDETSWGFPSHQTVSGFRKSDNRGMRSLEEIHQHMTANDAVQILDDILENHEKQNATYLHAVAATTTPPEPTPPPLPPLPPNRPRLNSFGKQIYMNDDNEINNGDTATGKTHPRWQTRAKSVPNVFLDSKVLAAIQTSCNSNPKPPPVQPKLSRLSLSSEECATSTFTGQGTILPAQNYQQQQPHGNKLSSAGLLPDHTPASEEPQKNLVGELQAKLLLRRMKETSESKVQSSPDEDEKCEDYYEDIEHYQNLRISK